MKGLRDMPRLAGSLAVAAALAVGLPACQVKDDGDNLVAGKKAYVAKCGSCHVLKRAGTTGVVGPNLDEAFHQARRDGFGESTFQGVVRRQIANPARTRQLDPKTRKPAALMPADLVTGETAEDVAAYVAFAAAKAGEDAGQLATVGVKKSTEVAKAEAGKLDIPADPGGALSYLFGAATAEAGTVTLTSPNDSSVDHNIAVDGNGVDVKGPVVKNGGVSKIEVELEPGEYAFYCSVEGHRQGGMEGKLTVQ